MTKEIKAYAVIDDYGDEALTGSIAHEADTVLDCIEWAEDENYHSASIVKVFADGTRERVA